MNTLLDTFSRLDLVALAVFLACWVGYESYGAWAAGHGRNLSALMTVWRRAWLTEATRRDNRIIDSQIMRALGENSAFLASTAIFVIGGLVATIGATSHAVEILNGFGYLSATTPDRFGLMVAVMIVIFTYAFYRLAWSIRLHNNAAVVLGAIPQPDSGADPAMIEERADIAATLATLAGRHYNGGMHSYYFGLAACAWFASPWALMGAAAWVVAILYRREFRSRAHAALKRGLPKA